jgi:hypothetical protein
MTRTLTGTALAVLLTASLGAQSTGQQGQQPPPTPPTPPQVATPATQPTEVTLVGCIAQGTSANVYLFENAIDPAKKDEKAKSFRLASSGEEMDFTPHLNHKVQIVGTLIPMARPPAAAGNPTATPPTPPQQQATKIDEKDLPILTVKSVTMVATTCSTPAQ